MNTAIIVDIDGTLSNCDDRRMKSRLPNGKTDFKIFNAHCTDDEPNDWCITLMNSMKGDCEIILVTGREEAYREQTIRWLNKHSVDWDMLLMRAYNDYRPDFVIKKELYNNRIRHNYKILFVVDDRKAVVDMWRDQGLVCLQCAEGNF